MLKQINTLFIITFLWVFSPAIINAQENHEDYSTPLAAFHTYLAACKDHDFTAVDKCYTEEFNRFTRSDQNYIAHRHVGQLDNEYNSCANKSVKAELFGNKAILRLYPEDKKTPPFFMVKETGRWKIDGMFMFNNIMYDQNNEWFWKHSSKNTEQAWINNQ